MKRGQQVFPVSNYEDVQKCPPPKKKTLALWKLIKKKKKPYENRNIYLLKLSNYNWEQ